MKTNTTIKIEKAVQGNFGSLCVGDKFLYGDVLCMKLSSENISNGSFVDCNAVELYGGILRFFDSDTLIIPVDISIQVIYRQEGAKE